MDQPSSQKKSAFGKGLVWGGQNEGEALLDDQLEKGDRKRNTLQQKKSAVEEKLLPSKRRVLRWTRRGEGKRRARSSNQNRAGRGKKRLPERIKGAPNYQGDF